MKNLLGLKIISCRAETEVFLQDGEEADNAASLPEEER